MIKSFFVLIAAFCHLPWIFLRPKTIFILSQPVLVLSHRSVTVKLAGLSISPSSYASRMVQPCIPSEWQVVQNGDELEDKIYEYQPGANSTLLAGIAPLRGSRGLTSVTPESRSGSAASFRRQIEARDGTCAVTGSVDPFVARLLLKRLGDDNTGRIIQTYVHSTSLRSSTDIDCFHPILGILLAANLVPYVARYELGFWNLSERDSNSYILHCFLDDPYALNLYGIHLPSWTPALTSVPPIHDHKVDFIARNSNINLLPSGVFDWHYLRCVMRQFGTAEYKDMPWINFDQVSFPVSSNDGNEHADDLSEPSAHMNKEDNEAEEVLYPSYRFETAIAHATQRRENIELLDDVAKWVGSVQEAGE